MSLRLHRLWPILGLVIAGETFALGLGDIRLSSALNEPLRAEIQLVSATPEDLADLKVSLASSETFERYGLYRPLYLTRLEFTVVPSGRADGNVIRIRSDDPVTEPFVTFLVEASWPRGRLLREYTVLLDPPTFAPPPVSQSSQAVTAPSRAAPADRGQIERPAPPAADRPAAAPFDTSGATEVQVERGDTLWGIADRVRPDNRLNMNQTMVAIYEANPQAFGGNMNRLNAGATLRIPSADDIFRISRADAMSEVQRQNAALGQAGASRRTEPRLTLVPPDAEAVDRAGTPGAGARTSADPSDPATEARIRELEETIEEQQSLIEVRDDELAQLREELARIRAQAALPADAEAPDAGAETEQPPPAEDTDRVFADDTVDAGPEAETAADETPAEEEAAPAPATTSERAAPARVVEEPGLLDRIIGVLTGFWGILGLVLIVVLGLLVWLAKRAAGRGEEESTGVWDALDAGEEVDSESLASTERLRALARDDDTSIVVVEQENAAERRSRSRAEPAEAADATAQTGTQPSIEDTFSSDTAINLDQSDPIAEADFHMAYGLYDQAADLINGALAVEPERQDLMAKLAEIYFVWGNRDAFVDAAGRLHDQLGGESTPDWDKIVIMGRQIAGDHRLFSGASAGAAGQAVDLSLDSEEGELDIDFAGGPDGEVSDVVDLTADDGSSNDHSGIDFLFDEELDTGASTTREMPNRDALDPTVESPTVESPAADSTAESPTLEQSYNSLEATSELPSIRDDDDALPSGDATAEIDLDDLGLDLHELAASGLGDLDDLDDDDSAGGDYSDLDATTESGALAANDDAAETGRNRELEGDDDLETAETGILEAIDADDMAGATGEMPTFDEATGKNPAVRHDEHSDTDVDLDVDSTLLEATGQTQVLPEDFDTIGDDDKTMLASLDDDEYQATAALGREDIEGDFDFAKTEALPKDAFAHDSSQDETGEMPSLPGATDVDLDLDDLTAALRLSEGDTVDQPRDDATVERPQLKAKGNGDFDVDLDLGAFADENDESPTEALSPDDFSDDLHEARTMTEVGTKLDLARAYVDMGDPDGARSILEEVIEEGDDGQRQQAQKLIDSLPA